MGEIFLRLFSDQKYNKIFRYCLAFTLLTILIIAVIFQWDRASGLMANIVRIFEPVIWGAVIAFIMNPIMHATEGFLQKRVFRKKPRPRLSRALGIIVASIVIIAVIAAVILSIIPEIISNIPGIYDGLVNDIIPDIQSWITRQLESNPSIAAIINNELNDITISIRQLVSSLVPQLTSLLASLLSFANSVKNFLFGFILAIYFLFSKESLQTQTKKAIVAIFSEKVYHKIFSLTSNTNHVFLNFIYGKIIDSTIIGIICAICMLIFGMPYVMIISLIIGITNIIPIFGPFIGAIPSAVLVLIAEPKKVIWFILFVIALQQLDGNVIEPKILGDKIGLSSFWVLFSILVCSSMFGFVGLIIGVPLFAVIFDILDAVFNNRLKKKNMPVDDDYYSMAGVNIGTVTNSPPEAIIDEHASNSESVDAEGCSASETPEASGEAGSVAVRTGSRLRNIFSRRKNK